MHKRLAENGLRYIRGKVIGSVEEAIEFYDAESLGEVVIKPIRSAGSCNVRICLNKQEMIGAIEDIMGMEGYFGGNVKELLFKNVLMVMNILSILFLIMDGIVWL